MFSREGLEKLKELEDYIRREGKVLSNHVLKVNSFLNHQVDPTIIMTIGQNIAERFQNKGITKVITIEASGIHVAFATALALNTPFVYAKKTKAITQSGVYSASVYSFTRQQTYQITVSKEFLTPDDHVLIVDDILAEGAGVRGLLDIIRESGSRVAGVSVVIEKSFQNGRKSLDDLGIEVFSLARIARMSPEEGIEFIS